MEDKSCMILNLWPCRNYGALLTCFGVKCLLEELNYKPQVINYFPNFFFKNNYKKSFTEQFSKKYLNLTERVNNIDDFIQLNKKTSVFIAGSDQIWNNDIIMTHHEDASEWVFLLDFVQKNNKKISYSASFGAETLPKNGYIKSFYKYYLKQFDAISVREESGLNIIKNELKLNAEQLIDGAFHISKSTFDELTKAYEKKEKYAGYYCLPGAKFSKSHKKYLEQFTKETGLRVKKMILNDKTPVEEWLAFIKNSDFIISGSYHAIVCSIIFNKPFFQLIHPKTQSRFDTLYKVLDIPNSSINIEDNFNIDIYNRINKVDWTVINNNISNEVQKAQKWMREALEKPLKNKDEPDEINHLFMITQKKMVNSSKAQFKLFFRLNKIKLYFNAIKYKTLSKISFGDLRTKCKVKYMLIKSTLDKHQLLK